jgi:hypothetical protein
VIFAFWDIAGFALCAYLTRMAMFSQDTGLILQMMILMWIGGLLCAGLGALLLRR